jgi:hypothetical protein
MTCNSNQQLIPGNLRVLVLDAGSFLRRTCSEFRDRRRHRHFLGIYNRCEVWKYYPIG